jgi:hypothetical protein
VKKPSIPSVNVADQKIASLLRPMKENLEILTGARGGALTPLPSDADLSALISKVNAIIARLNA